MNLHAASPGTLPHTDPSRASQARQYSGLWILVAMLLAVFYLATSLYVASHRLLWFDEIVTVSVARLPDWRTILTALSHGADSLPPPYYLVVRMFGKVFGHAEMAMRLPSTLAMVATLLITFDCARRLTDGLHGLIALAIAAWPLAGEGFEARPYAIYAMFAALALWSWTYTGASERVSAILFGIALFLGVSFHYYAVLLLVPYAMWEVVRWKPWRLPSPKLIAGIIGIVIPAVILSHFILSFSHKFAPGFWSRPSLRDLTEVYSHIFVGGFFVLAWVILWIVLAGDEQPASAVHQMLPAEAVGWLFLCIPLAGFLAAELKTNAFAVRYFLPLVPGVAVAFACWTWRHFHNAPRVSLGIFILVAVWGVTHQLQIVRHPEAIETPGTRDYLSLEGMLNSEGKEFFVFSDPFQFLEAQYYSRYPDRCVLLLPSDFSRETSGRSSLDPYMHQRVELLLSQYYPLQIWQLSQLQGHAHETALIKPTPEVSNSLRQAGVEDTVRLAQPVKILYLQ